MDLNPRVPFLGYMTHPLGLSHGGSQNVEPGLTIQRATTEALSSRTSASSRSGGASGALASQVGGEEDGK